MRLCHPSQLNARVQTKRPPRISTTTFIPSTRHIYVPRPVQHRTSLCSASSSGVYRLVCDFCSSGREFASSFFQIPPHDGHPCSSLTVPTAKSVVDFHHQVVVHAAHTEKSLCRGTQAKKEMVARLRQIRKGLSKHELLRDECFFGLCLCPIIEKRNAAKCIFSVFDYSSDIIAIFLAICQLIAIVLAIPQMHSSKLLNKWTNFEVALKRQKESSVWLSVACLPIRNTYGRPRRFPISGFARPCPVWRNQAERESPRPGQFPPRLHAGNCSRW